MTRRKGIIGLASVEAVLFIIIFLLYAQEVIGITLMLGLFIGIALITSTALFLIIRNTPPEE
ncbi:hypothetical protein [Prevotella sp. KH2C16]|uniref:hypothetical protein n=1 Tax=Prevotella sp. KH2C16 TaxID=1855325 RepID=UPI0008EDD3BC|nr:hypothetical protein [Prevotella sp. KH2C16]SFG32483.1 hypothetical protein SAMN05216383_11019 [Prevotella sp. KH2C16]